MTSPAPSAAQPTSAARWYGLTLLLLVYSINSMDRFTVLVVMEPIKHEFRLTDAQLGFMSGLAYALIYSVFAIPVGMLADRFNRRNLLAGLLTVWSLMTAACGLARNFTMLLAARMVVGAAEAGASPVSSSIISDLFPPDRRATAVAIYFIGTPIASIITFLFGSAIASSFGWRATFLLAGVPGLILAVLLFAIMKEPTRGAFEVERQPASGSPFSGFRELFGSPVLICVIVGMSLATLVSTALQAWAVSIFIREHGFTLKQAGATVALTVGLCGGIGAACTGPLADAIAKGDRRRLLLFTAGIMTLAMFSELTVARAPTTVIAFAGMVGFGLTNLGGLGPGFSVVLNTTTPANRGLMIAAQQVSVTLIGAGVGPWALGLLSDRYGGPHSVSLALATLTPITLVGAGLNLAAFAYLRRNRTVAVAN
jgi:predicted MFS family arabinose efflux permease